MPEAGCGGISGIRIRGTYLYDLSQRELLGTNIEW